MRGRNSDRRAKKPAAKSTNVDQMLVVGGLLLHDQATAAPPTPLSAAALAPLRRAAADTPDKAQSDRAVPRNSQSLLITV
jgi:hypothetical protein